MSDVQINKSDNEVDRVINSYYCGQIYALHLLVYFLWRSKKHKYSMEDVLHFLESRYCYLIREFPNYYNTLVKNDKVLGKEAETSYKVIFEAMHKHFKDIRKKPPKL